ncbi:Peptidyl-tRNA hydrolase [Lachnellula hyalina]|uniref:peptidyl-tRNA hydrolase n=1 Tax=Lachnellula hyalina TaxID=1316788 RepID=A0A8H8U5D4_9HELO|nr:Peptidyl-tRNA hydrolase [Lachnellula hyalina]TVY31109.1 Peptidyl-tRNA hydrolase [Lachnellula hyalina]
MADRTPPTPVAMLIGTAIIAGISGYMIGIASSLGFLPIPFATKTAPTRGISNYDDEEESEEEDIDESILDHAPNWSNGLDADKRDGLRAPSLNAARKQQALLEEDSKIAAQCSHATLACYKNFLKNTPKSPLLRRWETQGQAKVALQVKSEEELDVLQATAISMGLVAEVIADAGRTQIASGSHTVLGIGPAPKSLIDKVTGKLKLL